MSAVNEREPGAVPRLSGHLPALDGLRGIAVLLVLAYHWAHPIDIGGNIGVDVFFALSGYLITGILIREWRRTGRIRFAYFYVRRAIRLYPPLLLCAAIVLVPALVLAPSTRDLLGETVAALLYLTPISQFVIGDAVLWYHTWTLALEEWYYLIWPVAMVTMLRIGWTARRMALASVSIGLVLFVAKIAIYAAGSESGAYLRVGGLLLGSGLALYFADHDFPARLVRFAPLGIVAIAGAVVLSSWPWLESIGYLFAAGGTVLAIPGLAAGVGRVSALLSWRPLVYVGTISYELYLWHYPILVLGMWATGLQFNQVAWWAAPLAVLLAAGSHALTVPLAARLRRSAARLP